MKASFPLILASAVFLIGAAPAPTEYELGSNIAKPKRADVPNKPTVNEADARVVLADYARCIFAKSPAKVVAVTEMTPGEDAKTLSRLASSECLSTGIMKFGGALFRGALFSEMYRRHETAKAGTWSYTIQPLNLSEAPPLTASPERRTHYFLMLVSDCLYQGNAASMKAIVTERADTVANKAAFNAVIPNLGGCIPQGMQLKLSRPVLEAAFGEYMYRSLVPIIPAKAS